MRTDLDLKRVRWRKYVRENSPTAIVAMSVNPSGEFLAILSIPTANLGDQMSNIINIFTVRTFDGGHHT